MQNFRAPPLVVYFGDDGKPFQIELEMGEPDDSEELLPESDDPVVAAPPNYGGW